MTQSELIHVWSRCSSCGMRPVKGRRYECRRCPAGPQNDLCESCYRLFEKGVPVHPAPDGYALVPAGSAHHFVVHEGQPRESYSSWLVISAPRSSPPVVPDRFVVLPEFRCGLESFFGAQGFVIELDSGERLLLTAIHVMDELAKSKQIDCSAASTSYKGTELPAIVTKVILYDVFAPNWMMAETGTAGPMLVIPGARSGEEEPYCQGDIAAFRIDAKLPLSALKLADRLPQPGELTWLALGKEGRTTERAFASVVVEQTERSLIYRFESSLGMPTYSSGSPLLNGQGEVVGINVGVGYLDGQAIGHATHVASIRRHLQSATER